MLSPIRAAALVMLFAGLPATPAAAQGCRTVCDASGCQTDCSSTSTVIAPPQEVHPPQAPIEDDSCQWANDDVCADVSHSKATTSACPTGTDHTDCLDDGP